MKNAVIIFVSTFLGVLALAVVMTIMGRMGRGYELQNNLSTAVEETVLSSLGQGDQLSDEQALALCVQDLVLSLDSDSGILLQAMKSDAKKGLLSVSVTEKFKHPNGKEGETKWDRTVILDKGEEEEMKQFRVRFYRTREEMLAEENCYKTYLIQKGDKITEPPVLPDETESSAGWKDINQYIADFSQPVEQDQMYYAID